MNKILLVTLTMALVFALFACDTDDDGDDGPNTPSTPRPFNDITAAQLVANIKVGWNLGNTLDATAHGEGWPNSNKNLTVEELETLWDDGTGGCVIPVTTKSMITALKTAGFNAIRLPVSWEKAADANYNIRADWMARVVEIVNYAVDNDMYIIINTHHDEYVFKFMNSNTATGQMAFRKIWEQIADTFKNYDEKLIFEALNEPRTTGSAAEWNGGTAEERKNLNAYYIIFVNTVRASGGNNDKRMLMITPYAAAPFAVNMDDLVLPNDTRANKLIVSIHAYAPYQFALNATGTNTWSEADASDKSTVTSPIDLVYNKFVSNGIPVIFSEFGAWDKNNEAQRAEYAKFYVSYAKSKSIPCFWWDGGDVFRLFNRSNNTFYFPQILAAIMEGATGL